MPNFSLLQVLTLYIATIYILYILLGIGVEKLWMLDVECQMSNVECFSTPSSKSVYGNYIHTIYTVRNWGRKTLDARY